MDARGRTDCLLIGLDCGTQSAKACLWSLDAARLTGLGVAFQRETFTLEDRSGRPMRPGILWLREHEPDVRCGSGYLRAC